MRATEYEHFAAQLDADIERIDAMVGPREPEHQEPRYKLLGSTDLAALPAQASRIRGVLPAEGLAGLYGPSGSGKSFLGLDMGAAIAESRRTWFDCRVDPAPVVYVALEGEVGIRKRVQAWETHHARPLPEQMHLVLQPFKVTEPQDVIDLAAVIPPGAVLFVDTLNRAAPTADENSSRDMGEILEGAKRLQSLTGGLVVFVHHTGKDATKGLRGHSSLFAALDAAVEVTRDGDRRRWSVAKSKDAEDGTARAFKLAVVELGTDELGDPITSCVVASDSSAEAIKQVRLPQGGNQRIALDVLRPQFRTGQLGRPGAPPLRPCIELQQAVILVAGHLTVEADRRAERARTAITGLVSRGVLGCSEGWLWLQ
jgi:putative DNA primase/helicase